MVGPGATPLQCRVQAAPALGDGGAEAFMAAGGLLDRGWVGGRVGQAEGLAVAGVAAGRGSLAAPWPVVHDAVGADPAEQPYRFVAQQPGEAHDVVAAVQDEQHCGVVLVPLPGFAQAPEQVADLGGGDVGGVVVRAEADCVDRAGPRGPSPAQGGCDLVGPAGDGLARPVAAARAVTVQALGRALGVRTRPGRDVQREGDLPVGSARQLPAGQCHPQPRHIHAALGQRVVHRPVPAPVHRLKRQLRQRDHRSASAQDRVRQLEQCVRPQGQACGEITAEPGQPGEGLDAGGVLLQTVHHGLWLINVSLGGNT